jgi:dTDP-4-dehydrorhamnose reductase
MDRPSQFTRHHRGRVSSRVARSACSSIASCRRVTRSTSRAATRHLIERQSPYGLYHCVNAGHATWHDLAVEARRISACSRGW